MSGAPRRFSLSSLQRMESREKMGPMKFSDDHVSLYNEYTQLINKFIRNEYIQYNFCQVVRYEQTFQISLA